MFQRYVCSQTMLLSRIDRRGIGTVAKAQDRRQDEQRFNAQCFPDPAAEQGDEYRDQMIDRYAGRDGEMVARTSSGLSEIAWT